MQHRVTTLRARVQEKTVITLTTHTSYVDRGYKDFIQDFCLKISALCTFGVIYTIFFFFSVQSVTIIIIICIYNGVSV